MAYSITFLGTLSKAFFHVNKTHIQLLVLLLIFLLHSSHNEYRIHCYFPGINPNCISLELTCVCICPCSTLSTIFMACSSSFTHLYDLQLITSPFPLKIGTITLVFHSSGIPLPSNTR